MPNVIEATGWIEKLMGRRTTQLRWELVFDHDYPVRARVTIAAPDWGLQESNDLSWTVVNDKHLLQSVLAETWDNVLRDRLRAMQIQAATAWEG